LSKLFKFKEWLTVPDAARHLSNLFDEEVTEAEVLRLALNGHLKLSINFFNFARVRHWKFVQSTSKEEFAEILRTASPSPTCRIESFKFNANGDRMFTFENVGKVIEGVWDLPMLGDERLAVEQAIQTLVGGPTVKDGTMAGVLVEGPAGYMYQVLEDNRYNEFLMLMETLAKLPPNCQIEERSLSEFTEEHNALLASELPPQYVPTHRLPIASALVVRAAALADFGNSVREHEQGAAADEAEKPLSTRERNTLLKIIGALCKAQGFDLNRPTKTAGIISNQVTDIGFTIDQGTIEGKLKQVTSLIGNQKPN
jgi:hypothetical protein